MNKRILELAIKAGINLTPAQFSGVLEDEVSEFDLEKFAELIICECAAQAETKLLKNLKSNETHQLSYNEGLRDGVAEFKKQFGVK